MMSTVPWMPGPDPRGADARDDVEGPGFDGRGPMCEVKTASPSYSPARRRVRSSTWC